jgi:ABC-type Fe3+/spermidine/putrescine transport system ATPase subunit
MTAGRDVVDQLDLAIAEGEFLSLLGPSAPAETTTLMMLAGFKAADGGPHPPEGQVDRVHAAVSP